MNVMMKILFSDGNLITEIEIMLMKEVSNMAVYKHFLVCLSNLGKLQNPPGNFIMDVTKVLMEHQSEFSQNY